MYKKLVLLFFLSFILTACGNDEPDLDLFHLTVATEADADFAMGMHSAEFTINGYARWIEVGIIGDFDSYSHSDDIPDWLTIPNAEVIATTHEFRINVSALGGDDSRIGKVDFTVIKGNQSQSGTITITQNPCTLEDLKKTEQRAMKKYLSKFDVINELPTINNIQVGSVAPFYKLNPEGTVYMQVVKTGNASAATNCEKIYFRFMRYNLLSYLENGVLPQGQRNANDPTESSTLFEVVSDKHSTSQWGTAIQIPILLGLPIDSEVNLVVASEAGPTSEICGVIPFLYNIRYYIAFN